MTTVDVPTLLASQYRIGLAPATCLHTNAAMTMTWLLSSYDCNDSTNDCNDYTCTAWGLVRVWMGLNTARNRPASPISAFKLSLCISTNRHNQRSQSS